MVSPRPSLRNSKQPGFTLLELLVAIGLLSLLVLTLSLLFSHGLRALHSGYDRSEMYSGARIALDQMMREIPTVLHDGTASYPFFGYLPVGAPTSTNPGDRGPSSVGPELYFMGQVSGNGDTDVVELGYWLRDTGAVDAPFELRRFYVSDRANATAFELYTAPFIPRFNTPPNLANSKVLMQNAHSLSFVYHYRTATGWAQREDWNSTQNLQSSPENWDANNNPKNPDGLPNAVEIILSVTSRRDILARQRQNGNPPPPVSQVLRAYIPLEE